MTKALRYHFATFLVAVALLAGTLYLFFTMPTGFIPSEDSGFAFGAVMGAQDISFESMAKHLRTVAGIAAQDPNVDQWGAFVGDSNTWLYVPVV